MRCGSRSPRYPSQALLRAFSSITNKACAHTHTFVFSRAAPQERPGALRAAAPAPRPRTAVCATASFKENKACAHTMFSRAQQVRSAPARCALRLRSAAAQEIPPPLVLKNIVCAHTMFSRAQQVGAPRAQQAERLAHSRSERLARSRSERLARSRSERPRAQQVGAPPRAAGPERPRAAGPDRPARSRSGAVRVCALEDRRIFVR